MDGFWLRECLVVGFLGFGVGEVGCGVLGFGVWVVVLGFGVGEAFGV